MLATLIRTSYAGATNNRGSRIIVSSEGRKRVVQFDYSAYNAHTAAVAVAFNVDAVDVDSWPRANDGAGGYIILAPFDVRMPEPAADTRPSVTIRRVKLDNGGYDTSGRYFGIGAPLYSVTSDDIRNVNADYTRAVSYRALADDYRARGYRVTR